MQVQIRIWKQEVASNPLTPQNNSEVFVLNKITLIKQNLKNDNIEWETHVPLYPGRYYFRLELILNDPNQK